MAICGTCTLERATAESAIAGNGMWKGEGVRIPPFHQPTGFRLLFLMTVGVIALSVCCLWWWQAVLTLSPRAASSLPSARRGGFSWSCISSARISCAGMGLNNGSLPPDYLIFLSGRGEERPFSLREPQKLCYKWVPFGHMTIATDSHIAA